MRWERKLTSCFCSFRQQNAKIWECEECFNLNTCGFHKVFLSGNLMVTFFSPLDRAEKIFLRSMWLAIPVMNTNYSWIRNRLARCIPFWRKDANYAQYFGHTLFILHLCCVNGCLRMHWYGYGMCTFNTRLIHWAPSVEVCLGNLLFQVLTATACCYSWRIHKYSGRNILLHNRPV